MLRTINFIFIIIISFLVITTSSCNKLETEHEEARNVEIANIDFSKLKIGEYQGYYAGGMYGWRENECNVWVDSINSDSSRVVTIELVSSESDYTDKFLDTLYSRVIRSQSLQIDAVSGATLDSKACLKGLENALIKAELKYESVH